MFTGLVEEAGIIESIRHTPHSIEMIVKSRVCGAGLDEGDSLAVNGCCLTVVSVKGRGSRRLRFDLLQETWNRTGFRQLAPGNLVNLERSLRADGRLGGHFVTGHIDGTGSITRWERAGADWVLQVAAPKEVRRYLIPKGSIAIDGISLTVAEVTRAGFIVWIIPHTLEVTALRERKKGDAVNLEADMLGKFVDKLLPRRIGKAGRSGGLEC